MKLNKLILILIGMLIFQIIAFSFAITAHELSHESDYKDIIKNNSTLCLPFMKSFADGAVENNTISVTSSFLFVKSLEHKWVVFSFLFQFAL